MHEGQDWCVQCGAARKGRVSRRPGWLTGAAILAATLLLVAGASVAAYAALTKPSPKTHKLIAAQTPAATSTGTAPGTVPPAGTTTPATPGGSSSPTTPGSALPSLPKGAAPPKIPTQEPTPEGGGAGNAESLLFGEGSKGAKPAESGKGKSSGSGSGKGSGSSETGGKGSGSGSGEGGGESGNEGGKEGGAKGSKESSESGSGGENEGPTPILLDTNAAHTYNPKALPSNLFGDPTLAIDGEESTYWTAAAQSSEAPHMAAGLVLDLRTAQKLGSIKVRTATPGFTVEMYGANGHNLPATIEDPAWKKLHKARVLKKKLVTFKLNTKGAAYRFVLLWLVKAPPGSTAAKPGAVKIAEVELFPPS